MKKFYKEMMFFQTLICLDYTHIVNSSTSSALNQQAVDYPTRNTKLVISIEAQKIFNSLQP